MFDKVEYTKKLIKQKKVVAFTGADVIEVNTSKSNYTESITDIFLQGKAEEVLPLIYPYRQRKK